MTTIQRLCLVLAAALLASGCVYRINIQQGNYLDQAAVNQVKEGMTRSQVRYLLGTPLAAESCGRSNAPGTATRPPRRASGRRAPGAARGRPTAARADAAFA